MYAYVSVSVDVYTRLYTSVTQLRMYGTPFPKITMIAQSLCWVSRVCWRHICFAPSLTVAERRALLSLHLHFVAQYKFLVIIIMYSADKWLSIMSPSTHEVSTNLWHAVLHWQGSLPPCTTCMYRTTLRYGTISPPSNCCISGSGGDDQLSPGTSFGGGRGGFFVFLPTKF